MKNIGTFQFPETNEERRDWSPVVIKHALAMRVLAVASTRIEGTWSAYIDAVPGMYHDMEVAPVLLHGVKLKEEIARVLFPVFTGIQYAH